MHSLVKAKRPGGVMYYEARGFIRNVVRHVIDTRRTRVYAYFF